MARRKKISGKKPKSRAIEAAVNAAGVDQQKLLAVLRGNASTLRETFSEARAHATVDQFYDLVDSIAGNSHYRSVLLPPMRPQAASAIKQHQALVAQGLERELAWCVAVLRHHAPGLHQFVEQKFILSDLCIGGCFDQALEALDAVEGNFGPSLWSYAIRLLLQEIILGQEENNRLYSELRGSGTVNSFVYFIIFYLGFRTTAGATAQLVRARVPDASANRPFAAYLRNRLAPFGYGDPAPRLDDIESILRLESNSTIVDLYQAVIRAIGFCIDHRQPAGTRALGRTYAKHLADAVADPLLLALEQPLALARDEACAKRTSAFLNAYDAILRSRDDAKSGLGQALAALGWGARENSVALPLSSLPDALSALVARATRRETAAVETERVCMMFAEFEPARALHGMAEWFYTGGQTLSIFGSLPAAWMSGLPLPDFAEFIDSDQEALAYLDAYERRFGAHLCIDAQRVLRGVEADLPVDLRTYVRALRSLRSNDRSTALNELEGAYHAA